MASTVGGAAGLQQKDAATVDIWTTLENAGEDEIHALRDGAVDTAAGTTTASQQQQQPVLEPHVLFVGPKQAGKTSLLNAAAPSRTRYRTDGNVARRGQQQTGTAAATAAGAGPAPTLSLDYAFTSSAVGLSSEQRRCHFWELGGGEPFANLLDVCIQPEMLERLLVVVVLDLSHAGRILRDLDFWIKRVRTRITEALEQLARSNPAAAQRIKSRAAGNNNTNDTGADAGGILPSLGVPVIFVASKFDRIKRLDSELLKVTANTLRSAAHTHGATLIYGTTKSKKLQELFRKMISRHLLQRAAHKATQLDHMKPIIMPHGLDSFKNIGMAPGGNRSGHHFAGWSAVFRQHFPAKKTGDDGAGASDDADMNLAEEDLVLEEEHSIDSLVTAREAELKRLAQEVALRRKMQAADTAAGSIVRID